MRERNLAMKRIVLGAVTALLAGCSGAGDAAPDPVGPSARATAAVPAPVLSPPPAATAQPLAPARQVKDENAVFSFTYSYPAAAAAIPPLRVRLEADLAAAKARLRKEATAAQAQAALDGYPYHAWYWSQKWSVVTDLPLWLSLSAEYGNYTGGAHGMYWFGSMLWDKAARVPLFTSKQALSAAIRAPFCAALDQQRARKRAAQPQAGSKGEFDACIDPVKQTVIVGSRGGQGFDRIGILVPPYEAGPYAEGSYEVTVPVTAAVMKAIKPQYRASFIRDR